MTDTADRFRDWDAAYVLGALDSEDRRTYERHLAGCPACSAAVAEFAGMPGILSKLVAEEAVALLDTADAEAGIDAHLRDVAHTPGPVQRLAVAASRRRRRARLGMLGAGITVVALLAVGGVALTTAQTTLSSAVAMVPVRQGVITAAMSVTPKSWGTRFDWSCSYPRVVGIYSSPVSYDLIVVQKSGARAVVATWVSAGPRAADLTASSDIPYRDINSVEIRATGSSAVLLRENL